MDRYASEIGGTKVSCPDRETALLVVRAVWPGACQEGSTGDELTFTAVGGMLVGHFWRTRRRDGRGYLRVKPR